MIVLPFLFSGSGKAGGGGVFSFFRSLTAGKTITRESMSSVLEKMKEHLISMCGCGLSTPLAVTDFFCCSKECGCGDSGQAVCFCGRKTGWENHRHFQW